MIEPEVEAAGIEPAQECAANPTAQQDRSLLIATAFLRSFSATVLPVSERARQCRALSCGMGGRAVDRDDIHRPTLPPAPGPSMEAAGIETAQGSSPRDARSPWMLSPALS
jgi:hypothetical protein